MGSYIIRRVLILFPTLLVIGFLVFALLELAPGDPMSAILRPGPGSTISAKTIAAYRAKFALDKPFLVRFACWLGQAFQGNFGLSVLTLRPVVEVIGEKLLPTLWLSLGALLLSLVIGIPIGIISGIYRYSLADYVLTFFAFAGISTPNFFIGLVLIYLFAITLKLFPFGGMTDPFAPNYVLDVLRHLFLPSLALGVPFIAGIVRFLRSAIIDEVTSDYVRTALAKGLTYNRVLLKHVLRNSLSSLVTIVTTQLPLLMGGAVVVETVFIWPGMGLLLKHSIYSRDYPVIMGFVLLVALFIVLSTFLADILYGVLDPRIRY